jgi:hypothetical protein
MGPFRPMINLFVTWWFSNMCHSYIELPEGSCSYGNKEIITYYHVAMYIDCIVLEPIRIPSSSLWASSNGKMGVHARELIPTKTHRTAIQLVTSWVHLKKGFLTVASGKHLVTSSSVPSLWVWFWLKYVGSHFNVHGWSWTFCPWKLLQNWG